MSKSKKQGKKKEGKGGGFGRALFGLVALTGLAAGGVYFAAPDLFARGLELVGVAMP